MLVKKVIKKKKAEVLENPELLLKGQKVIYSGYMDGIFESSDMHKSGREEDCFEKYNDEDDMMIMNFTLQKICLI